VVVEDLDAAEDLTIRRQIPDSRAGDFPHAFAAAKQAEFFAAERLNA
jgi:hypothetical protein